MQIDGKNYRTIWPDPIDPGVINIIDQRHLPHQLIIERLRTPEQAAIAIAEMHVRGAPLIGATAAWGMYLAAFHYPGNADFKRYLAEVFGLLKATRPTAVNLVYALNRIKKLLQSPFQQEKIIANIRNEAEKITEESVEQCHAIGQHGLSVIRKLSEKKGREPIQVLTHCNAGWLACIDYGTATAPIYLAQQEGIPIHVWVDETRPRNQGARLTAYELGQAGVPHTIITDNAGGHLMQHGRVDMVLVGTDRTSRQGDVANKVGTYLKALAAYDNHIPFYVAAPSSSIDWTISDGLKEIEIEEREEEEVKYISGRDTFGKINKVLLCPADSPASNYAFDVTPARLVTGLITERGICEANEPAMVALFPEFSTT